MQVDPAARVRHAQVDAEASPLRLALLRVCAAAWGVAIALGRIPALFRMAPRATQPPGFARTEGFNASAPVQSIVLLCALPLLAVLLTSPFLARLSKNGAKRWSMVLAAVSLLSSLWLVTWLPQPGVTVTVVVPALLLLAGVAMRREEARFHRQDIILIPVVLTTYFALFDLAPDALMIAGLPLAAVLILALRVALARLTPPPTRPATLFALAPLALTVQTSFAAAAGPASGMAVLSFVFLTPLAMLFVVRRMPERSIRLFVALVVFPIAAFCYPATHATVITDGLYRVDFFEHGHDLEPASEMLRGERPFADFIPGHGLIEDGGLDYVAIRLGGDDLESVLTARHVAKYVCAVAVYATAFAVSGSPEAGYLATLFSIQLADFFGRAALSLFAVAAAAVAVRRREPRLLAVAGALTVAAGLYSFDFGAYALAATVVAAMLCGQGARQRLRSFGSLAAGGAIVAIPLALLAAAYGVLGSFMRTLTHELPRVAPAYVRRFDFFLAQLGGAPSFPGVLAQLAQRDGLVLILWFAVVIATAAMWRSKSRRWLPFVVAGTWCAVAALSYAERNHTYAAYGLAAAVVAGTTLLIRTRQSTARHAGAAIAGLLAITPPFTTHFTDAAKARRFNPPSGLVMVRTIPRARFALFPRPEAERLIVLRDYLQTHLKPGETFFEFSNAPILYYLLNLDCPIRQYEVPFYESREAQLEVIEKLKNPRIAYTVIFGTDLLAIDGVSNQERAPLVWEYVRTHFTVEHSEKNVQILRRIS